MRYLDQLLSEAPGSREPHPTPRPSGAIGTTGLRANEQTCADPAAVERAAVMLARHPRPWRAIPFLTVRDVPRDQAGCRSCGEPVAPLATGLAVRCRLCAQAARLASLGGARAPPNGMSACHSRSRSASPGPLGTCDN